MRMRSSQGVCQRVYGTKWHQLAPFAYFRSLGHCSPVLPTHCPHSPHCRLPLELWMDPRALQPVSL
eukprot:1183990-Prorocentrum_minimum.AAC.2